VLEEKMRTARKGGKRTAERLFKLLRALALGTPDGDLVREHDGKTGLMDLLGHFALSQTGKTSARGMGRHRETRPKAGQSLEKTTAKTLAGSTANRL
jgi:hypothetical protein